MSPEIENLLKQIANYPPNIRYIRPKINALLSRDRDQSIDDLTLDFAVKTGLAQDVSEIQYVSAPEIQNFAARSTLYDSRPMDPRVPLYLSDEKPLSIKSVVEANKKPIVQRVELYEAEPGEYAFSLLKDIPLMFRDLKQPSIIKELSANSPEAIYCVGGRKLWKEVSRKVEGTVGIIHDEFFGDNYCHWLLDWMPRFALLEAGGFNLESLSFVLGRRPTPYQAEMLRMLKITERQLLIPSTRPNHGNEFIAFDRFVASSTTSVGYRHALHGGSKWALNFLRSKLLPVQSKETRKRIIVDREKTRQLRLTSGSKRVLEAAGFERICLEGLSVSDQINLFSSAEAIVAAHGAGLSNIAFCRPGTAVLELFPQGYSTGAYWLTADAAEAAYSCAVVPRHEGSEVRPHVRDYDLAVPDEVVEKWLDTF